ncbi:hypothetical protein [Bacillus sp. B15-48]|uniref:hypothetical protein n=1 Tax=Bacillus sp. B15-48 TaxID=1548601 RepID=UPI00193FE468|nr:hypothetical protein [Bacillus sp. B15-48]MBM4762337.1 hypothetical protein [Bacillus sp. B15-48]
MEFLFENPILLILLIGLLSSLFKKPKAEEKQEQRRRKPPARPEQRQPEKRVPRETMYERRTQQPHNDAAKGPEVETKENQTVYDTLSELQKKFEERQQERVNKEAEQITLNSTNEQGMRAANNAQIGSLQLKPDADRLIEGIAWAQILGQPRAKDPHRTRRR